jgi:uncharacterized protein (DUF1810 family)
MTHAITRPVSRFIDAQRAVYPQILREIRQGRKRTHWMWFVFPQLSLLAKSETARYYGLADKDEALAYLDEPSLRLRLGECTMAVLGHDRLMFSHPDNRKLQASMTLFSQVVVDPTVPNAVLEKFYGGQPDQRTLDILNGTYVAPPQTAMGRVEVGRHWDKGVRKARAAVESVGVKMPRDEPMLRAEVESYVKSFGLSAADTKRLVAVWMVDQDLARNAGWESHADSVWYDENQ